MVDIGFDPDKGMAPLRAHRLLLAIISAVLTLSGIAAAQETFSLKDLTQSPASPLPNLQYFSVNEEPEAQPVRQRPRPGYEATGVRGGSFIFFPSLLISPFYDSNVFAVPTGEQSDGGIIFSPTLYAISDWNNHALSMDFGLHHREYFDLTSESRTDAYAVVSGRVDVRRDLALLAAASVARRHETRGTSNSPLIAAEPVPYDDFDGSMSVVKSFNRFAFSLGAAAEYRNYHDVKMVGGGTLDQDFRDGSIVTVGGRVAYLMRPGIRIFGDARYNWRQYDNLPGLNSDSQGYNLLGGVEFTLTSLMRGEIGVGYLNQTYAGAGVGDSAGLSFSADLIWNPTPLMTLTFNGLRSVNETGLTGTPGRIDSSFGVVLDYELRRNVIISPSFGFVHEDYAGISRTDNFVEARLEVEYLINRYFSLSADYAYTLRDSSVSINDFDRHLVSVNAQAKF